MTKEQALYAFWSSFGWPAVDEQSDIDEDAAEEMGLRNQRIEYEVRTGDWTQPIALTGSLFHRSTSWAVVTQKAKEIEDFLGVGGYRMRVDGGYLWITRSNPFLSHDAPSDPSERRVILNINANFLTAT